MSVVYIDNSTIAGLALNRESVASFGGCFQGISRGSKCSSCRDSDNTSAYSAAKSCLAGLSTAQRSELKRILGASEVRIRLPGGVREVAF